MKFYHAVFEALYVFAILRFLSYKAIYPKSSEVNFKSALWSYTLYTVKSLRLLGLPAHGTRMNNITDRHFILCLVNQLLTEDTDRSYSPTSWRSLSTWYVCFVTSRRQNHS